MSLSPTLSAIVFGSNVAYTFSVTIVELDNLLRFEDFIKEKNQKDRKKPFNKVKSVKDYMKIREDYIHSFIDEHERGVEPEEEE